MQLLRDNLTLWTSSDGAEGEASGAGASKAPEAATDETKAAEPAATEAPAAAPTES